MAEYQELISNFTGDDEAPVEINEIGVGGERVALIYKEKYAPIIDRAVNACISINPENPLAVAKGIRGLREALGTIKRTTEGAGGGYEPTLVIETVYRIANEALASIERGK